MNFRKETIELLSNTLGLSYDNASKLQRRLYRQVLRRYDVRPFIASRELYYSIRSSEYGRVKISRDYLNVESKNEQESPKSILETRMENLIKHTGGKRGKVEKLIKQYTSKKISYSEFKKGILAFKRSAEYLSKQKEKVKNK